MRDDSIGFFWQERKIEGTRGASMRIMPDIPDTGWTAPREFPRLDCAPWLNIDCEVKDPDLLTHGPGWGRGRGNIVGVAVGVPGQSWYFPVRHEVKPEENLDPLHVFSWLRDSVTPDKVVSGANLIYDLGWLGEENCHFQHNKLYDVQWAEALLSEDRSVALEHLAQKYLGKGKETSLLYQWASDYYGGPATEKQRANIWRCPPSLVGPYAQGDVDLPREILPKQWVELMREGVLDLYEMEMQLLPLYIAMRRQGVRVDLDRAEQAVVKLADNIEALNAQAKEMLGYAINVDSNDELQKAFATLGIPIPLDHKTRNPSFTKDTLAACDHEFADLVTTIRKRVKVKRDFLESAILEKNINGRLHPSINPLRGDDSGTRSGRYSYQDPNLQQVPSRDEELAPIVRGCFWPNFGHKRWRRWDYSQIEYRFMAHFAVGRGSDELRAQYNASPDTDYHVNAQTLVTRFTGLEIPRKPIKNLNFGLTFGMGQAKLVRNTYTELKKMGGNFKLDGEQLYNAYHEAMPFTKATMEHFASQAMSTGQVRTILGRISRFDMWEYAGKRKKGEDRGPAYPYETALQVYGSNIKRAYSHKALNRVLQGSGTGDLIKTALLKLWKSGVFSVTGVPLLTVHDELDFSDPGEGHEPEAWGFIQRTLETAIPIRVPIIASLEFGECWADAT